MKSLKATFTVSVPALFTSSFIASLGYALGFSGRLGYGGRPRRLVTATVPRAKLIEGIFKIVQDRLRADSGFVGFDERAYRQEELQDAIGRVKRGTLDPRTRFHSLDGWVRRIGETFTDYLQETQNGKLLDGFSPAELWANRQPLEQLPQEARYILASHCVKTHMSTKGLRLTIRGQSRYYYDAQHSGQYVGQNVLAFYNVETPHMLTVTDLDRKNPFTLTENSLPAFSATKEQFSAAKRAVAGHMQPGKVRFGQIEHPERSHIVHDNSIDAQAGELGRFIQGEQQKDEAGQKAAQSQRKKVYTSMARAGVDISGPVRNPESVHRGLELLNESNKEIADEQ
ncbi:MAG TPA: hypothetical protein VFC44_10525 [Candidatus Saccharimonadales bacterium]|nr:hypothetical protein [Candidatus Saccharimonadales bacterium]